MNKDLQSIIQWDRNINGNLEEIYPTLCQKPLTKLSSFKLRYILSAVNYEYEVFYYNREYYNSKEDTKLFTNVKRYKKQIENILANRP